MSTRHSFQNITPVSILASSEEQRSITLADLLFFFKLRWHFIAAGAALFGLLALAYVAATPPSYVANTQLVLSPQISGTSLQRTDVEDAFIEGQLEIVKSNDVLAATVRKLDLQDDPDFLKDGVSIRSLVWSTLTELFGDGQVSSTADTEAATPEANNLNRASAALGTLTWTRRIGRSSVMEISASGRDPDESAEIANAMAQEYIAKNLQMKSDAAKQYSDWLERLVIEQQKNLTDAANNLAIYRSNPRDQYRLTELQSQADARRTLFENTLTQFTEAKQRISLPVSDATIVSPAVAPLSKARPRSTLIIAFALSAGLGVGIIFAMIKHASDRRIRRNGPLADVTGAAPLAAVRNYKSLKPIFASVQGSVTRLLETRSISSPLKLEELTTVMVGLRRKRKAIVGVAGITPGCGATTIARELAVQSAASGARTLLIDAVPTVAQAGAESERGSPLVPGLGEAIDDVEALTTALRPITPNLTFLPFGQSSGVSPAIRLSSHRTELSIAKLKQDYDAIFIDLAAVSVSSDINALGPELDGVLLVVAYGRTTLDDLSSATGHLALVGADVLGTIVNRSAGTPI
jgi:uncharacterized protein involved in exopolysaccharide biosynthesis/Mrp family chromosome partitioning ATPase